MPDRHIVARRPVMTAVARRAVASVASVAFVASVVSAVSAVPVVSALRAQARDPSPRELLHVARPLTAAEIATVLRASRAALAGKTLRMSWGPGARGPEVLMGPAGQPRRIRTISRMEGGVVYGGIRGNVVPGGASGGASGGVTGATTRWHEETITILDYTGRPARHCDGLAAEGEMVIEYTRRSSTHSSSRQATRTWTSPWTVIARRRAARGIGEAGITPALEMLQGAGAIASGERQRIGDRWARAFISPWTPPPSRHAAPPRLTGDPLPNVTGDPPAPREARQLLWIDTASLLPLRWEVLEGVGMQTRRLDVDYASTAVRPPAGLAAPACIR